MTEQDVEIQQLKDEIIALKASDSVNTIEHQKIMELLQPISETYRAVNLLGKWTTAILVFVSILLSVFFGWAKIISWLK